MFSNTNASCTEQSHVHSFKLSYSPKQVAAQKLPVDVDSNTEFVPLAVCTVLADHVKEHDTVLRNMFKQHSHSATSVEHGAHYFLCSTFQTYVTTTRSISHEMMFLDLDILQTAMMLTLSYLYRQQHFNSYGKLGV